MEWTGRENRQALQRIVALLFAFAALADRAGATPRPIRVAVLWLLRAAERVAWEFVLEQFQEKREPVFRPVLRKNKVLAMAEDFGGRSGLPASPSAHDVADDAMRLAQSFRALAELLAGLVRCSPPLFPPAGIRHSIRDLLRSLRNLVDSLSPAMFAPESPDTS